jgi:hypothetical protein
VTFAADTQGGDKSDAILLLDEPGLFLHATAQASLLKFFDQLPNQIIYGVYEPLKATAPAASISAATSADEGSGICDQ